MCGFAGFLDPRRETDEMSLRDRAAAMARTLSHRGPDQGGEWADPQEGIALATRRLAILDLSPLGDQPMHSPSGRYVLAYNGEVYNFRALRAELLQRGHRFFGDSDTEVLIAGIETWGVQEAVQRVNGMFAFAAWDRLSKTLYLARDRLGEKPLYYGWTGGYFIFGSQLSALRAHPSFSSDIDRAALTLFMRHKYIPGPLSIYEDIRKLEPGTCLQIRPHRGREVSRVAYWSAREAVHRAVSTPFAGSDEDAATELESLLRDAVALRMESDVPLGAFLSGGVDSSAVVALMQETSSRSVKTFTVALPGTAYDEGPEARAVARHLGTDHSDLVLGPAEVMEAIPRLPLVYDEPFSDSSQIPTSLIAEFARKSVTVALSGDGGDEVFGGYNRYVWVDKVWRGSRYVPVAVRKLLARGLVSLSPAQWNALFARVSGVLPASGRQRLPGDKLHKLATVLAVGDIESMYLGLVSHWQEPMSLVIGGYEQDTAISHPGEWPELGGFTQQMMYLDLVTYLPDDILTKLDRATMAVSLEGRVPFLDHRVVEFAWRLPLHMKIRGGETKWLLRKVLYRRVPRRLIDRPKSGFGVPIDSWLRGPLREWAEELLDERRLKNEGFLEPNAVRVKWDEHISRRRNWQYHLWDVLMFQAWLDAERSREGSRCE